jgi:hypothetical protein
MTVQLKAIKLNHDQGSATEDALNIRRNASAFVTVPEWQHGVSVTPEDSPACFAIEETNGHVLTIKARFSLTPAQAATAQVRAIDPKVHPAGQLGFFQKLLLNLLAPILRWIIGNVLGEVKPRTVTFGPDGDSGYQTFELTYVRLWSLGVGSWVTKWRWQYRATLMGPWQDIVITSHRIYAVLDVPTHPWQQAPYSASNIHLPWAEVLDYACAWAEGGKTQEDAATAITKSVYDLGPAVIEYDCQGGGMTNYAYGPFFCSEFLERLKGGVGYGQYVNCTDCATIVSTFANALGCDLWQSEMGSDFELNPILAIGSSLWEPACVTNWPWWPGSFSYHEVAWKGGCTSDDEVFDACLKVDADPNPMKPPHTPLLVANVKFGYPGDGLYRDRLATPSSRKDCNPQPSTKQRRSIS